MTRIDNINHIVLLLRDKLQRMDKTRKSQSSASINKTNDKKTAMQRLRAVVDKAELNTEQKYHILVNNILADEFGSAVTNDPAFLKVVDRVVKILMADEQGAETLKRAIQQIEIE